MLKSKKIIFSFLSVDTTIAMMSANVNASAISNRVEGSDRVKTFVEVANSGWIQSDYAVIAYAWDFPNAVSAAPLAYKYHAPILLTNKESLNPVISTELTNLKVKHVFRVCSETNFQKQ